MDTTTIKLNKSTKNTLDTLRRGNETYDAIIKKLVAAGKHTLLVKEMEEGYKTRAKEDKEIAKEWDTTSLDEEW